MPGFFFRAGATLRIGRDKQAGNIYKHRADVLESMRSPRPEMTEMIKKFAAVLSLLAVTSLSAAAFAQEEEVSDAVDQTLWCGGLFAAVTQIEGVSAEDKAIAEEKATAIYTQAVIAMEEDGIAETEHDRLLEYYTGMAVDELTTEGAEMRYTAEECDALIAE
jgi:hypothetical protein